MATRDLILNSPETLSDLAWAAEQRFREAEALMFGGRFAGSVYLLGLAAEMWLKFACFKSLNANAATSVASQLGPAKSRMKLKAPGINYEAYHSLLFWAEYLIRRRASDGTEMPSLLSGQLRHHVNHRLFHDWKIDVRYRFILFTERQCQRVYNDVSWLKNNWQRLWR